MTRFAQYTLERWELLIRIVRRINDIFPRHRVGVERGIVELVPIPSERCCAKGLDVGTPIRFLDSKKYLRHLRVLLTSAQRLGHQRRDAAFVAVGWTCLVRQLSTS